MAKSKPDKMRSNVFKIIAIVVVALFALILVGGLIKMYRFHSGFSAMSQQQAETAKAVAMQDLQSRGKDAAAYEIQVMPKIRKMGGAGNGLSVAQVSFHNPQTMESYLIDIDSGRILMHSETDYYDGLIQEGREKEPRPWFPFAR